MESVKAQIIDIEPKKSLHFEGPFTETVVSHIQLTNPQPYAVCFKVKTTVPKRYCVRPSSGILKPDETLKVAVMLQPFNYDPQERSRHKFMIQSMQLPEGDNIGLDQVWKEADPSKILDWKLVCILRMPGELVVEPSHDIVFDGPIDKPMTSFIVLTNPSTDPVCFKLQASSQNITAAPSSDTIMPGQTCKVTVKAKPLDLKGGSDVPRERLMIKSIARKENESRSPDELLDSLQTSNMTLKCIFSGLSQPTDEKIKPVKQGHQMTTPINSASPNKETVETLMTELAALRKENKMLKESDIHMRRAALSDTCLSSAADGGAAIGRHGALGAIASVPPILYLILAFFVGLILGKFAL